jgi:hypothetical protein
MNNSQYFNKIQYNIIPEKLSVDKRSMFCVTHRPIDEEMFVVIAESQAHQYGLRKSDILLKNLGREVNLETFRNIADSASQ